MAYYDWIRIYGLPDSEKEAFQGLGAAAMYNAAGSQPLSGGQPGGTPGGTPGEPETTPTKIPETLWTAQNNLIQQQSAYLSDIKETFTQKRDEMGDSFDMKGFTESDTFKALVGAAVKKIIDLITDVIPGVVDDVIVDTIASYAPRAIGWGLVWLKKHYTAGAVLCERMKEENGELLNLSASLEAYRLRSQIISQHDMTIQSLLSHVAQVESQLAEDMNADATTKADNAEPAIQCPHTGDYILAYSRGKMTKS